MIAFLGSVFSPYYAAARRRTPAADPLDHCAINVSLYGPAGKRWTMTERGRRSLARDATTLQIGPSALRWDGDALSIDIDEWTVPWPSRLRGRVRVHPRSLPTGDHPLDAAGRHRWQPIAPSARVEVEMAAPALRWSGPGYFDANRGDAPLEADFVRWDWSRTALPRDGAAVLYDVEARDGHATSLVLRFDARGGAQEVEAPRRIALPPSAWRVARGTRSEGTARVLRTLEDAPFYARSLVETQWLGAPATAMHESLALDRFSQRWVQALLPFRMPRRVG